MREFLTDITYRSRRELDEIAGLVDLDFEAFLKVKKPYMSFEQLMDLKKRGFYLGSHSMDHPLFADLDPEDQEKQYRASMEYLRDEFRLEYGLFSFPFHDEGVSSEFLWNLSAEYLPKLDASFGCRGLKNDPVPYHYQRIPMEVGNVPAGIIIRGEYIYYLLKGLFGRNTVKRK